MPMMTAEQYEESLRRLNLVVYLFGERIDNPVDHPMIRPSMQAVAKTYAMAGAAALSITLVPVLMGYFIRGRIVAEDRNPINRLLIGQNRAMRRQAAGMPLRTSWLTIGP